MAFDKISKFASLLPIAQTAHAKALSEYKNIFDVICRPAANATNLDSITCTVKQTIQLALDIGGILAFIMISYASIIYLTSYGEESRIEIAKKTLIWSVVGFIVIILARSLLTMFGNAIR